MNLLASDFIISIGVFRILPNIFDGEFCVPPPSPPPPPPQKKKLNI